MASRLDDLVDASVHKPIRLKSESLVKNSNSAEKGKFSKRNDKKI